MTEKNNNHPNQMVPSGNGKIDLKSSQITQSQTATPTPYSPNEEEFDQPVILRQSPLWPKVVLWTLLGVVTFGLAWSYFAKIEQAVSAQGQLQPQGDVKKVQSPIKGVIEEMATNKTIEPGEDPTRKGKPLEEGDFVKKGQTLLHYDSSTVQAKIESLKNIRSSLQQENQFYQQLMNNGTTPPTAVEKEINRLDLPPEIAMLARNRTALVEENRLYRAQIGLGERDENLGTDEIERLQAARKEANTRSDSARLEKQQIQKKLRQVEVQIDDTKTQLQTEQDILEEMSPLLREGAVPNLQYVRQEQKVQEKQAKLDRLVQEKQRLLLDLEQAEEELNNTQATTQKNTLDRIAQNKKQIAQIDSQLTKALVANTSKKLMKIVPQDHLIAKVFITNQDIGFVKEGMKVDVRIDTFPFSEYGDLQGELISVGSDALPPNETYDFFRFPAKIRLDSQTLNTNNREIPLQSGMSVSANIKLREDRRVISLFIERFTKEVESLKNVR